MEIICLKEKLKKALNIAERIIGRNLTLPILNNLLLNTEKNKLRISSTNLEIGINCWLPVKVKEKGSITVPAKLIAGFVNNLPNKKVEIKNKNNQLQIKCESYKSIINGLSADDFPIIPKVKSDCVLEIKGSNLRDTLSQVVSIASFSESRPEISGVFISFNKNNITLAATDSFRLAEKNLEAEKSNFSFGENSSIIVPQRTIQELIRILGEEDSELVKLFFANSQILFDMGNQQIVSRLIEGQYPDYQQIIPDKLETEAIINKQELINSVKLSGLFSGKAGNVNLLVNPKKSAVIVSSKDTELGQNQSQIEAKIKGKEIEATLNYQYILEGLSNIFSDKVVLGLNDNSKPVLLKPVGDISYNYIVMPIKV